MPASQEKNSRSLSIEFLESPIEHRLEILKNYGLSRYSFLTKMQLTEANIHCLKRFLENPKQVKFPNLQGANLAGLNLEGVNFIRGNLRNANLEKACLLYADLLFVNFTNANLKDANLAGATVNETIWTGANVEGCNLENTTGLTPQQKQILNQYGAKT